MPPKDSDLLNLVNAAGFLFQMAVQHDIESTYSKHGKTVLAREHRWVDPDTRQEGFVDLVITAGTNGKIVVECKRVRDSDWVFLIPSAATKTRAAHVLWTKRFDESRQGAAWDGFNLDPGSLEAEFCVVRGHADTQQPMLERVSSSLIRATEAVASEELAYKRNIGIAGIRFYFPLVVTSAKLHVCRVQPSEIDLASGDLKSADFEEVPFLRFTKSMPSRFASSRPPSEITEATSESRRTVLVANASRLLSFLTEKWEFGSPTNGGPWPWDLPAWHDQQSNGSVSA